MSRGIYSYFKQRGTAHVARLLQSAELRPPILSDASIRNGADGAVCQAQYRSRHDLRSQRITPEIRKAIEDGRADAWQAHADVERRVNAGEVTSGDVLGSRDYLKNNYLYRMHGTVAGIWGNAKEEAIYPGYYLDSAGQPLDGRSGHYELRFTPDQLPPVNAFWSLTMYELPSRLLVANPINRYLINSPMLPDMKRDADGGLTLIVQRESPGKDKETNWLPAPNGPFLLAMRLYWPKAEALEGRWKNPSVLRVN
jgi:hypothetical protein